MNNKLDPETLKIPAYMRKKMIISQAKQKLILTALDRKQAHLPPNSQVAMAPFKRAAFAPVKQKPLSKSPRKIHAAFEPPFLETTRPAQSSFSETSKTFTQTGLITHYLDKIHVAIIMLNGPLKIGDHLLIEGEDNLFIQEVDEMQIERKSVNKAKKSSHIGLKVRLPAAVNGKIYKVSL